MQNDPWADTAKPAESLSPEDLLRYVNNDLTYLDGMAAAFQSGAMAHKLHILRKKMKGLKLWCEERRGRRGTEDCETGD